MQAKESKLSFDEVLHWVEVIKSFKKEQDERVLKSSCLYVFMFIDQK